MKQFPMVRVTGTHGRSTSLIMALHSEMHHTVIVDYQLHPADVRGDDLTMIIRQNWPEIKVIVLTAMHDPKIVRACVRAGALAVLRKSESMEQLSAQLRAIMIA